MRRLLRYLSLLLYSLAPGIAKLTDIEALFGAGLLFLILYFALQAPPSPGRVTAAQRRVAILLLAFVGYAVALGTLQWPADMLHEWTTVVGLLSFVVPLACVAAAGAGRCAQLLDDIPAIAGVHALIALLIYPPLRADVAWLQTASDTLLDGALAFRLASVSGSLAMSTVMVVAFAVALRQHFDCARGRLGSRLAWLGACVFLLCTFLSLQRAAWVALCVVLVVAAIKVPPMRRSSLGAMLVVAIAPLVVAATLIDLPEGALDVVLDRFDTLLGQGEVGAVAERSDQWINVTHNLTQLPLGFGPGQLGQAVRDVQPREDGRAIFDGDYFRIVSEYGFVGIGLTVLVLASLVKALRNMMGALGERRALSDGLLSAAAIGVMLQGIGTNVTELYFANTVFWALLLRQWNSPRHGLKAATVTSPAPAP